ncbi:hypothetical protein KQX54_014372 [Cotesia glomerata]|uniref:Uncharacterized protein n=1 Tax=Cotesia glomerata TaxID=32391 RepID=A0AAV7IYP5_COTGL|nr:hypothetical protein KQX54_014372 [Cotesia glomerata]
MVPAFNQRPEASLYPIVRRKGFPDANTQDGSSKPSPRPNKRSISGPPFCQHQLSNDKEPLKHQTIMNEIFNCRRKKIKMLTHLQESQIMTKSNRLSLQSSSQHPLIILEVESVTKKIGSELLTQVQSYIDSLLTLETDDSERHILQKFS